ncbi:unnamed protein product [Closterium sp. NIES-65]|nr:unnamed protein product [Closterium sp. NIES-65]
MSHSCVLIPPAACDDSTAALAAPLLPTASRAGGKECSGTEPASAAAGGGGGGHGEKRGLKRSLNVVDGVWVGLLGCWLLIPPAPHLPSPRPFSSRASHPLRVPSPPARPTLSASLLLPPGVMLVDSHSSQPLIPTIHLLPPPLLPPPLSLSPSCCSMVLGVVVGSGIFATPGLLLLLESAGSPTPIMVLGVVVGSGIFATPGVVLLDSGGAPISALIVWLCAGIVAYSCCEVYAELGSSIPHAGGDGEYIQLAFGDLLSFVFMWMFFFVSTGGGIAILIVTFARYTIALLPGMQGASEEQMEMGVRIIGCSFALLLTAINCAGVKAGALVQNILTVTKALLIAAVVACAPIFISLHGTAVAATNFSQPLPPLSGYNWSRAGAGLVAAVWAFDGWNCLGYLSEELKNPKRDLPRSLSFGMLTAVGICVSGDSDMYESDFNYRFTLLCGGVNLAGCCTPLACSCPPHPPVRKSEVVAVEAVNVVFGTPSGRSSSPSCPYSLVSIPLPIDPTLAVGKSEVVAVEAVEAVFGPHSGRFIAFLVALNVLGAANATLLCHARFFYAKARDGQLFSFLSAVTSGGAPYASLLATGGWIAVVVFVAANHLEKLIDYFGIAAWMFYGLVGASLIKLRWDLPDLPRPYKASLYPLPGVIVVVVSTIDTQQIKCLARPMYLARTMPPRPEVVEAFRDWDSCLEDCFEQLFPPGTWEQDPDRSRRARMQLYLPVRLGGFGIRAAASLSPLSYVCGWAQAAGDIAQLGVAGEEAMFAEYLTTSTGVEFLDPWFVKALEQLPATIRHEIPGLPLCVASPPVRLFQARQRQLAVEELQALRRLARDDATLARFTSLQGSGAGAWVSAVPAHSDLTFTAAEWGIAAAIRPGLPIQQLQVAGRCVCGTTYVDPADPHHALRCRHQHGPSRVHDEVKFAVARISKASGGGGDIGG